jgi:hypothetical protein
LPKSFIDAMADGLHALRHAAASLRSGMNWTKLAIYAVIIVTAIVMAQQWRKGAAAVVLPVTLIALYGVWRWRHDE